MRGLVKWSASALADGNAVLYPGAVGLQLRDCAAASGVRGHLYLSCSAFSTKHN